MGNKCILIVINEKKIPCLKNEYFMHNQNGVGGLNINITVIINFGITKIKAYLNFQENKFLLKN